MPSEPRGALTEGGPVIRTAADAGGLSRASLIVAPPGGRCR